MNERDDKKGIIRISDELYDCCQGHLGHAESSLLPYEKETYLKDFFETLRRLSDESVKRKVLLGFLGDMSSGKSTLVNMLVGSPLLPVAEVAASMCPVEFSYGKRFSLEVFTYREADGGEQREQTVFRYEQGTSLPEGQLRALMEYARDAVNERVIVCENLEYFHDLEQFQNGLPAVDENDPYQVAQFLTIPLAAYIGQDSAALLSVNEALIDKRNGLLRTVFGLGPETLYGVRIRLDSALLQNGLVLVDLPGLGSDAPPHNGIATDYMRRADCCILVFNANGTVGAQNSALKQIFDFEEMKGRPSGAGARIAGLGTDSRFLAVMNKCDLHSEKNLKGYQSILATAARQIRPQIRQVHIAEILPISALYAEIRLAENGVSLENTVQWKKFENFGLPPEQLGRLLEDHYHFTFQYTDPITNREVSCSTARFVEETVGQYAARVQFLNTIGQVKSIAAMYGISLSNLRVQANMIRLLRACGDDLMRNLLANMKDAFEETQVKFTKELDAAHREIEARQQELTTRLSAVGNEYVAALKKADRDVNLHLDTVVGQMQPDFAGHCCIDGTDAKSIHNQAKFEELIRYFKTFDFGPYLAAGNNILKDQLDSQRGAYDASVKKLKVCFSNLHADCGVALEDAFDRFRQDAALSAVPEDAKAIYKECYDNAKNAILEYLDRLIGLMGKEIDADLRVAQEIDKTTAALQEFFDGWADFYHNLCTSYLSRMKRYTFWNERPFVDIKGIRAQINLPFTPDSKVQSFIGDLPGLFTAQGTGHGERVARTMDKVCADFAGMAVSKCEQFFPTIDASITNLFGIAGPQIMSQFLYLRGIGNAMRNSLYSLSNARPMLCALQYAREAQWASEATETIEEEISGVLTELDAFLAELDQDVRNMTSQDARGQQDE